MKYGCHNRLAYKSKLTVQDGYIYTDGSRVDTTVKIKFTMTTECQYTKTALGKTDPKCNNCERKEK
jgi:hypothetical protein